MSDRRWFGMSICSFAFIDQLVFTFEQSRKTSSSKRYNARHLD